MFIVDDKREVIINIDHAESIYTEDEQYLIISTDINRFSRYYGDKTKEVLRMIMDKIYQGVNVVYLPTNDELEDHHEDTDNIVPDYCSFCGPIPQDGQGYITSSDDGHYLSSFTNGRYHIIKIKYCPVCGRKLGG